MNHPAFLGNVNRDINATEEIWKFFSRHELPAVMPEPVPGDYNQNGNVDAADYVVWRNGVGTTYTQGDYDVWRAHFGRTADGRQRRGQVPSGCLRRAVVGCPRTIDRARRVRWQPGACRSLSIDPCQTATLS